MDNIRDLTVEAIIAEWDAFIQYSVHASYMQMMQEEPLFEHLLEHADEERAHAEVLTKHLLASGDAFDINVEMHVPPQSVAGGCAQMLLKDLEDEIITIDRYVAIVQMCDTVDVTIDTSAQELKILVEDIILDEIEHQNDLALTLMSKFKHEFGDVTPEQLAQSKGATGDLGTVNDFVSGTEVEARRKRNVAKLAKIASNLDDLSFYDEANQIDEFISTAIN